MGNTKIRVFCGVTIEEQCEKEVHPITLVEKAISLVDANVSADCYSNSPDFVSTIKYYGEKQGVEVEFFLDGKSRGNNMGAIFEDFNRGYVAFEKAMEGKKAGDKIPVIQRLKKDKWKVY